MQPILTTNRLIIRHFTLEDAAFILTLLNTPSWLQYIGDRNVKNLSEAEEYLRDGSLKNYAELGFGFYCVLEKQTNRPIGLCGITKREAFEDIDLGFAFLPNYIGKGHGFEAAQATLAYAHDHLKIEKIIGIVNPENEASIGLLKKIGMVFEKEIEEEGVKRYILKSTKVI